MEEGVVEDSILGGARAVPFTGTGSTKGLTGLGGGDCFGGVLYTRCLW